jgi:hypothetical protein
MITTQLNPGWLEQADYIDFLNAGFPGQWDRASLEFYTGRSFLGRPADLGVRAEGRRILAGVSYCFRQIRRGTEAPIDVCVMGAGTTLRSERGRGHYRELLESGLELCRSKSYAAILGFVTRDNGSARGLLRLGAHAIPSFYLVSGNRQPPRRRIPGPTAGMQPAELWETRVAAPGVEPVRFHYADPRDWQRQFTERPNPVRALRLAHDVVALVETVDTTDRLQWLSCPPHKAIASLGTLTAASAAAGRKFFMYTLDPLLARAALRLGLSLRAGLLMLLPIERDRTDWRALASADWCLHSGDRL